MKTDALPALRESSREKESTRAHEKHVYLSTSPRFSALDSGLAEHSSSVLLTFYLASKKHPTFVL